MPRRNLLLILASAMLSLICYRTSARNPYGRYFEEVIDQIEARYVKDVDQQALFNAAVKGMMTELDENSAFIERTEASEFQQMLEGEFGGIGIEVSKPPAANGEQMPLMVLSPIVGTPAYEAGILAGDQILEIDGRSTVGITLREAVNWMRGAIGEPVTLKILHKSEDEPLDMTIKRATIKVASVLGDTRNADGSWNFELASHPHLGYIRIGAFGEKTVEEMRAALDQVVSAGVEGLVIDLRFNPGGLLNGAVDICDMFIDEGTIVSIKGRNHELREQHDATPGNDTFNLPIVILINKFSASASEIVAACLQDYGRAVIVGERSYGKGTVQNVIPLEGGRSVLKLTTADYWRPSNRNIHRHKDATEADEWGVMPNEAYVVKTADEEDKQILINRQQRDVIGGQEESAADTLQLEADPQLRRAIEYFQEKLNRAAPKNAA